MASDYVYSVRIEPDGQLVTEWATEAFYRITNYTWMKLMRWAVGSA
jgi:hypothetical protein